MTCPECDGLLVPLEAKSETNELLHVDYCGSCGGFWAEHGVANKLSLDSVESFPASAATTSFFNGKGLCPRCYVLLERLSHSSLPRESVVKVCPKCKGNWFPKGEIVNFKRAQKARIEYFKAWRIPVTSVFQILLPVLVLVIVGASIPITVYLTQRSQEERIMASELVINTQIISSGAGEIVLAFSTLLPFTSEVKYGTTVGIIQSVPVSLTPQTFHSVKIKDLTVGSTYQYKITIHRDGKTISSPTGYFTVSR